jgi:cystathionine beta-lyase
LERSLKTLALRVERQTESAMAIASWLHGRPGIVRVNYPGLPSHRHHDIARKQMNGFGAMMSFEVEGNPGAGLRFMKKLKLIFPALSLGGVDSTICDPVSTSHQKVPVEIREAMGITANVLRLSVGIEHCDDLMEDLDQALRN